MPITAPCTAVSPAGSGTALRRGTTTVSAKLPWCCSVSMVRFGSRVSSPNQSGSPMIECSTTSVPSSSRPAPSQPRIIGNWSGLMPTPRSVQMSCMFRLAAATETATQPSGTSGVGSLPDGERLQRGVGVGLGGVDGEHA